MAIIGHIAEFTMTVGLMVDAEAGRMCYVFNQPISDFFNQRFFSCCSFYNPPSLCLYVFLGYNLRTITNVSYVIVLRLSEVTTVPS